TAVYVETQTPTTNANGLVSIEIGGGAGFDAIDWANGIYFIKTETDPVGGTNYTITGTSQLLSVPYALHAKTAESVSGGITETDPIFTGSQANNIMAGDITNLGNLSGVNTGDQDISGIVTNTQAIQDTASQIRADIPDVSGFLTSETDPNVPTGTQTGEMQYWNGTAWVTVAIGNEGQMLSFVGGVPTWTTVVGPTDVYNPTTGEIWMDRNLGASQVATSSTDAAAYGDLYQWGRGTDGHQIRTSGTTSTLSATNTPGHGNFITNGPSPYDWRSPQNDNLWQGVSGTNNPCPNGYRLPTEAEWIAELGSWGSNNSAGAFASPLKLPLAGSRMYDLDLFFNDGAYWSSTVSSTESYLLFFTGSDALMASNCRAWGLSVRCIKD
ncbi:MAG: hypothetical protein EOM76_09990, partial [Sphingobacteriia bacterium]|nr:hypothetical protein [Sphingobacteriia bacterium]